MNLGDLKLRNDLDRSSKYLLVDQQVCHGGEVEAGEERENHQLSSKVFNINYDSARGENTPDLNEQKKQESLKSIDVRSSLISSSSASVSLLSKPSGQGQEHRRRFRRKFIVQPP